MRRRDFLALTGLLAGLALTGCGGAEGNAGTLRFHNPLRIPPLLDPTPDADGVMRFALELREGRTEFLPGKPARTWGVNGDYLGPTLRARRGDRVAMAVTNTLDEPTTLHWHGMRLPARMDGGPHQTIRPNEAWYPEWTVDQPAATTWYHPHPHGETSRHVYRGLAGMFILDDENVALPSVYGTDDVPLIIQDKQIDENGELDEDFGGTWGLLGDQILVNGTHDPHFRVTTTRVRFRVLNAANAHVFHLGLADETYEHNFHIHEVRFWVLYIDGAAPPEHLRGPKDTVFVPDGARVRLAVEFGHHTDPRTPYMYHCHILKHEDNGMMGQLVIVAPGTEGDVARHAPTSGHGH